MLQFIFGKAGYGKTHHIYNQIVDDKAENENLRQILLVPDQFSFETERELLRKIGPSFDDKLQVVGFEKLARLVQKECGEKSKKTISKACKIALMTRALGAVKEDLQLYKKVHEFDSFAQKMVDMVKEFKQSNISPEVLRLSAADFDIKFKQKMQDFALIYEKYDELIAKSYTDSDDVLVHLNKLLDECEFFADSYVYIDGFAEFTEVQHGIIEQILRQSKKIYAAFCLDKRDSNAIYLRGVKNCVRQIISAANRGKIAILNDVILEIPHRFKSPELKVLSDNFFAENFAACDKKPENITIACVNSLKDEAVFACRQIRKLVMKKGYRYNEIAVIMRDSTRYKGILLPEFEKYEIPIYNNEKTNLASTALFKLINAMFMAITKDFKTDDIINLAKNNLYNLDEDGVVDLENYCEIWRKTRLNWLENFTFSPNGFEIYKSPKAEGENNEKLEKINETRAKIVENLRDLACDFKVCNAEKIGKSIYNWLENIDIEGKIAENFGNEKGKNLQKSFEKLVEILEISAQIFEGERVEIAEYIKIFEILANNTELSEVPGKIDEVKFGDLETIMLNNPKIVFVLGANADIFPNLSTDGILNIAERKILREKEIKINDYAENFAINEHFLAYNAFSTSSEKLYITYAKTSLSGAGMLISPFLSEMKNIFPQIIEIENIDDVGTITEKSLLDFAKGFDEKSCIIREYIKVHKPHIYARLNYYKLMPENLKKSTADEIFEKDLLRLSASKIEKFYGCPFAYFLQNTLRLKQRRIAEINAMQRGTILHHAIEKMVGKYTPIELINMGKNHLDEINFLISKYLKDFADDDTIENLHYNILEMAETVFNVIKNIAQELNLSGFKVHGSERKIEKKDGKISLAGYIDRVDVLEEEGAKYVRIVDYKTGAKKFDLNEVLYGQNLQMLIYLFEICKDLGGATPAGVLHMPVAHSIEKADLFGASGEKTSENFLKMNGILLDDEIVVKNAVKAEKHLPISAKKDGSLKKGSSTLKAHEFKVLEDYIEHKIAKMAGDLREGKIEINPFKNGEKSVCTYCDFREICRDKCEKNPHEFEKLKDFEQILERMQDEMAKEAAR